MIVGRALVSFLASASAPEAAPAATENDAAAEPAKLKPATYRAHDRLYASMALGLALFHGWFPQVLEGEGKLALVFGARRQRSQTAGLVGANLRLGWNFFHDERAPAPQIGAFIGFVHR